MLRGPGARAFRDSSSRWPVFLELSYITIVSAVCGDHENFMKPRASLFAWPTNRGLGKRSTRVRRPETLSDGSAAGCSHHCRMRSWLTASLATSVVSPRLAAWRCGSGGASGKCLAHAYKLFGEEPRRSARPVALEAKYTTAF